VAPTLAAPRVGGKATVVVTWSDLTPTTDPGCNPYPKPIQLFYQQPTWPNGLCLFPQQGLGFALRLARCGGREMIGRPSRPRHQRSEQSRKPAKSMKPISLQPATIPLPHHGDGIEARTARTNEKPTKALNLNALRATRPETDRGRAGGAKATWKNQKSTVGNQREPSGDHLRVTAGITKDALEEQPAPPITALPYRIE